MGIAYKVDHIQGLTVVVWDGTVSADDWRAHIQAMLGDPLWPQGDMLLSDQRTLSDWSELSPTVMAELAETMSRHSMRLAKLRCAVVARSSAVGAMRFREDIREVVASMTVVNYLAAGCSWLGANRSEAQSTVAELRRQLSRNHPQPNRKPKSAT